MTARATWKGVLQISRVTIPIKVYPATESSPTISFNQLHERTAGTDEAHAGELCHARVQQKRWCPKCDREVPTAEIVKGFEFEKDRYVILLEAELDAVQPPSSKVIDLVQFAAASALDPIYIDRSYYLAPDGPAAADAYSVLSSSMAGLVGIGKLAIYGREYLVAVRPPPAPRIHLAPLLLHTLHHAAEIRPFEGLGDLPTVTPTKTEAKRLAGQMIAALTGPLSLSGFTDAYQVDLRRLIDAKVAGQEIVESAPLTSAPVLDLLDALTQSLAEVSIDTSRAKRTRA